MFQSRRLTYRAVEGPEDDDFIYSIKLDTEAATRASPRLHRPPSKEAATGLREYLQKECLLGVLVCLTPTAPDLRPVPIGQMHLTAATPRLEHHRHSEIGIEIVKAYQGQGYGSEAIWWVLNWGFQVAGLHRIEIRALSWNEGAVRLYKRLGFVEEGRARDMFWINGGWGDEVQFAMLEHEWRSSEYGKGQEDSK